MKSTKSISYYIRVFQYIVLLVASAVLSTSAYAQSQYIDELSQEYVEATTPAEQLSIASQLFIDMSFIDSIQAASYFTDIKDIIAQHPTLNQGTYKVSQAYERFFTNDINAATKILDNAYKNDKLTPIFKAHAQRLRGIILIRDNKSQESQTITTKCRKNLS